MRVRYDCSSECARVMRLAKGSFIYRTETSVCFVKIRFFIRTRVSKYDSEFDYETFYLGLSLKFTLCTECLFSEYRRNNVS